MSIQIKYRKMRFCKIGVNYAKDVVVFELSTDFLDYLHKNYVKLVLKTVRC